MNNSQEPPTIDKFAFFKKMYRAHDIIADISERIENLYTSATSISPLNDGMPKAPNPKRFENIMVDIADLRERGETLLRQRAKFDVFVCSLPEIGERILSLRCEKERSWKEAADELKCSPTTAKDIYKRVEKEADEFGLFRPFSSENDR